jgi:hypothetical protein
MGKAHQQVAHQMRSELEEPLAAFSGGMKERRKIVQNGVEKLLKTKIQQTQQVNKVCHTKERWEDKSNIWQTRDKYEQECLKIKGYLAQGHMVMGQEERKNKAKLEKTQINLATSNTEYENAVKILEDTTARWNREWKSAADKFQDLEEERLDFTKSSLWTFANIASTVCVSDDGSCEKIRLSLENCEVEKDIVSFIKEQGTGQEIPDAPKYINFCRGDVNDSQSETSEDDAYSVAQFQRTINPAFRTSSPQPSTYESHHDPTSELAKSMGHHEHDTGSREATITPQKALADRFRQSQDSQSSNKLQYDESQHGPLASVPHDPYPMDGMTMLCRTAPPSDRSSAHSPARPCSRDSQSEYSNPTSYSSIDLSSRQQSPVKQDSAFPTTSEKALQKKKSGFFQSHSPFRRKSRHEKESPQASPSNRNTWSPRNAPSNQSTPRRPQLFQQDAAGLAGRSASPEPVDPRASFQLNVGNNVFDVATPDKKPKNAGGSPSQAIEDMDPIAQALAELKGVTKQSSLRMSADAYHGIATPAPGATGNRGVPAPLGNSAVMAGLRGTPPPSYDQPLHRLDAPSPAHTSKAMQQTRQRYVDQTQNMFGSQGRPESRGYVTPQSRPGTRGNDMPRTASPAPPRSVSPRPGMQAQQFARTASPNPYASHGRTRAQSIAAPHSRGSDNGYHRHGLSASVDMNRAVSPAPFREQYERPGSSQVQGGEMAMQLSMGSEEVFGSQRGRGSGRGSSIAVARPNSSARPMTYYGGQAAMAQAGVRQRSKSVADGRQFNRDGRPILHFGKFHYRHEKIQTNRFP